ncbi:hypothetical protein [Kitasatospora sp. CB01950]|uniref:hypothetical protein n=1 Tax=Kitasatospora sp. CB01950 TaxID=1703930 RepID=UPI00093D8932|nr:hypothetical protein [Kitasatospora sp. CB01950]OKJ06038.1 hypothetical protein AMK19_23905 [Kitasatospora sp. CB01950]
MASDDLHSDWAAWLDAELAEAEAAALRAHRREGLQRRLRWVFTWTGAVTLVAGLGFGLVYTAQHGPEPRPAPPSASMAPPSASMAPPPAEG